MGEMYLPDLVIIGASGFGREVANIVNAINRDKPTWNLLGLVDDKLSGKTPEGFTIIGKVNDLFTLNPKPYVVIAIGETRVRLSLAQKLEEQGFRFATIIHPSVKMGCNVTISEGCIICPNTILTTNIKIGRHCIINNICSIGHDTTLEDFVSLMSHTVIAGDVEVGEGCYFGLNCAAINMIKLGSWAIYGAGSVIVRDMPSSVLAVGVPAKVIKSLT